jgi:hypothetical protein
MRVTRISVALEKRCSDGDYGSERAEAEMFVDLDPGDDPVVVFEAVQAQVRSRVERDLAQSANLKVRRQTIRQVRRCSRCELELADDETGYMHADCKAAEDAERQERYREQREKEEQRWKETEERAEAELAQGLREATADPEEDLDQDDDDDEVDQVLATAATGEEDKPF